MHTVTAMDNRGNVVRHAVGLTKMNFPAPGAAQGRDLGVAAYEKAGVCADWGPWRGVVPRPYWQDEQRWAVLYSESASLKPTVVESNAAVRQYSLEEAAKTKRLRY